MWMILQQRKPDDFVLATGKTHSVREFVEIAFNEVGIRIKWEGKGINEVGKDQKTQKILIRVDKRYFRPTEVDILHGDYTKAKENLGWNPKISFQELVKEMIKCELKNF